MRVLLYSPGPPSRSDALMRQLAAYLEESHHSIGWRYFGAYTLPANKGDRSPEFENADAVVTIGWNHNINQIHVDQQSVGKVSYSISDGFVKRGWKPGAYFAATRNGLHAYGHKIVAMPGDRWEKLGVRLMPWQAPDNDKYVLIAHQHTPTFDGRDRQAYFLKSIELIREYLPNREIIVRAHPRDRGQSQLPPNVLVSTRALVEDLMGAWAVVTYDSNIAVDAAIFGVPAFTRGRTMADGIACRDLAQIVDPPKPDRQQWAHNLAYCQWSVEELRAGLPWIHLIDGWLEGKPSGLVEPVDDVAVESDYEYETVPEQALAALTDWNVKDGQTPNQVAAEIMNPKYSDSVQSRRGWFESMNDDRLKMEARKCGLKVDERYNRQKIVNRLIHASL